MKNLSLLLVVAMLAGCASGNTSGEIDDPAGPSVDFYDSNTFDSKLSGLLSEKHDKVTVNFLGVVTANDLPERIDQWLCAVDKYKGRVEVEPDPLLGSKGIVGIIIDLAFGAGKYAKYKKTFGPVKLYDVYLYHIPNGEVITRIVFKIKKR